MVEPPNATVRNWEWYISAHILLRIHHGGAWMRVYRRETRTRQVHYFTKHYTVHTRGSMLKFDRFIPCDVRLCHNTNRYYINSMSSVPVSFSNALDLRIPFESERDHSRRHLRCMTSWAFQYAFSETTDKQIDNFLEDLPYGVDAV